MVAIVSAKQKAVLAGGAGMAAMLAFYFGTLTLLNSFDHAIGQFGELWYWLIVLIFGFGLQMGLHVYIRQRLRERRLAAGGERLAVSGGITTGSMILCCTHHAVEIVPFLGASAVFIFLAQYQLFFIVLGIVSNAIGLIYALETMKTHELSAGPRLEAVDFHLLKRLAFIGFAIILAAAFLTLATPTPDQPAVTTNPTTETAPKEGGLEAKTDEAGGLSIQAQPAKVDASGVEFALTFTTHQGDLAFEPANQAVLRDNLNREYRPLSWTGGQGGHHLAGTLAFPPLADGAEEMTLVVKNIYETPERIFKWRIP